jgi:hypothetical protein
MIEIYEGIGRPQLLPQFRACDHLALMLQKQRQDLEWLLLDFNLRSVLAKLTRAKVNLEGPEANGSMLCRPVNWGVPPELARV